MGRKKREKNDKTEKMTLLNEKNSIQQIPDIIELNVGGQNFTTSLMTLKRFDSMYSSMFSGRHILSKDKNGRFFVDRDPTLFSHILAFLRNDTLPPAHLAFSIYNEAKYLSLQELYSKLEHNKAVTSEMIRNQFLSGSLNYRQKFDSFMEIGKQMAFDNGGARNSKIRVAIYKAARDSAPNHLCNTDVTFGPWVGAPTVPDLVDCILSDLEKLGYKRVEHHCIGICDQPVSNKGELNPSFCHRTIYTFTIQWW